METKNAQALFRLCRTSFLLFSHLYETVKLEGGDLKSHFNTLLNTVKIVFKLSKESEYDKYYLEEDTIKDTINILRMPFTSQLFRGVLHTRQRNPYLAYH